MTEQAGGAEPLVGEADTDKKVSVGEQLRVAREKRGITLQDVASTLKLGVRQLEAVEQGNWQVLPGPTFVRGFVRNYARIIGLDSTPLMAQLDETLDKPVMRLGDVEAHQTPMPQGGAAVSRRDRMVLLLSMLLVALASLVYFVLPNDLSALRDSAQTLVDSLARKDDPPAESESASEPAFPPGATTQQVINPQAEESPSAPPSETPAAAPETAAAPLPDGPVLRFVLEKESWIEVRDRDNKALFSQRSPAGSEQSVSGRGPFSLVIGNAPGVKLFWRGQSIDLVPYTRGDVARLVLE